MAIHDGIVATMFAKYPKTIDFSCGFQSYLPSGACSKARRERPTSRSNSACKNSVSFMLFTSLNNCVISNFFLVLPPAKPKIRMQLVPVLYENLSNICEYPGSVCRQEWQNRTVQLN